MRFWYRDSSDLGNSLGWFIDYALQVFLASATVRAAIPNCYGWNECALNEGCVNMKKEALLSFNFLFYPICRQEKSCIFVFIYLSGLQMCMPRKSRWVLLYGGHWQGSGPEAYNEVQGFICAELEAVKGRGQRLIILILTVWKGQCSCPARPIGEIHRLIEGLKTVDRMRAKVLGDSRCCRVWWRMM